MVCALGALYLSSSATTAGQEGFFIAASEVRNCFACDRTCAPANRTMMTASLTEYQYAPVAP